MIDWQSLAMLRSAGPSSMVCTSGISRLSRLLAANRLHCQHSPTARFESKRAAHQVNLQGVNFGRRSPGLGVKYCRPNDTVLSMKTAGRAIRRYGLPTSNGYSSCHTEKG